MDNAAYEKHIVLLERRINELEILIGALRSRNADLEKKVTDIRIYDDGTWECIDY